ncbi:MAG: ATP-binding protein [Vulcanisaeta sp.]
MRRDIRGGALGFSVVRRIRLNLASNLQVEFVDRDSALRRIEYWAGRGMSVVQVVHGLEGCGKTAWLLQSVELLRDLGFEVIYVNPINRLAIAETGVAGLRDEFMKLIEEAINQNALTRIAWIAYNIAYDLIKATRGKVAIIVDDAFQVIGVRESTLYVKALLNLIEYPPEMYERIVAIAATSEGVSRREIGRHRWADLLAMWNMSREGFRQLYEQIPGNKPDFNEVWRITGGNPKLLGRLYEVNWDVDRLITGLIEERGVDAFNSFTEQ